MFKKFIANTTLLFVLAFGIALLVLLTGVAFGFVDKNTPFLSNLPIDRSNSFAELQSLLIEASLFTLLFVVLLPILLNRRERKQQDQLWGPLRNRALQTVDDLARGYLLNLRDPEPVLFQAENGWIEYYPPNFITQAEKLKAFEQNILKAMNDYTSAMNIESANIFNEILLAISDMKSALTDANGLYYGVFHRITEFSEHLDEKYTVSTGDHIFTDYDKLYEDRDYLMSTTFHSTLGVGLKIENPRKVVQDFCVAQDKLFKVLLSLPDIGNSTQVSISRIKCYRGEITETTPFIVVSNPRYQFEPIYPHLIELGQSNEVFDYHSKRSAAETNRDD